MSSNRAQLQALLNSKVITGGNQTTAQNLRDFLNQIIASMLVIIDDKDANGGYLGIDANGIVDVTKIKQLTPEGKFLSDSGAWVIISTGTDVEDDQEIASGTEIELANTPSFIYGVYKNGLRLTLTDDYTISGTIITLVEAADNDKFSIVYKY